MSAEEWERKTGKPADACASCGTPVLEGDGFVASLYLRERAIVREDRCEACAEKEASATEVPIGTWRAKVAPLKGPASRRLDFETLAELFPRLDGRDDDASKRLLWVVALLLLRKKMLVQESRGTTDGAETLNLKFKHDERLFRVVDPRMDEPTLAKLHEELGQVFDLAGARR